MDEREKLIQGNIIALCTQINDYRVNGQFCDVDLRVEEKCFKCHRLILCAASEYFRLMFNGNFRESAASEITLHEIKTDTFERVLQFIYTGDLTITSSNFYSLMDASEFYKLPRMEKLLIHFIRENSNVTPIVNVFKTFSFVIQAGRTELIEALSEYVHNHLDYFSRTCEFFETPFDELNVILEKIRSRLSTYPYQDTFADAILRWIQYGVDNVLTARNQHSAQLVQKIDFTKISLEYTEYMAHQYVRDLMGNASATAVPVYASVPLNLHVFVNSGFGPLQITSVFTSYKKVLEPNVWRYSYATKNLCDYLRTTVLDDQLYCLSYSKTAQISEIPKGSAKKLKSMNGHSQAFTLNSTISLFSDTHLQPPPLIVEKFEICGMNDHIFLYNKCRTLTNVDQNNVGNSSFDEEQLSRGVYLYTRDVDKWLPVPQPRRRPPNACMACDDQIVYLIGSGNAQAYDHRTSEWIALPNTISYYEGAACCAHEGKIYVCGGAREAQSVEMYDKVAGKWNKLSSMPTPRRHDHRMISYSPYLLVVGESISAHQDVDMYFENKWSSMLPPLYKAIHDSDLPLKSQLRLMDVVLYKPYGF